VVARECRTCLFFAFLLLPSFWLTTCRVARDLSRPPRATGVRPALLRGRIRSVYLFSFTAHVCVHRCALQTCKIWSSWSSLRADSERRRPSATSSVRTLRHLDSSHVADGRSGQRGNTTLVLRSRRTRSSSRGSSSSPTRLPVRPRAPYTFTLPDTVVLTHDTLTAWQTLPEHARCSRATKAVSSTRV